ncbi:MAG: pentapeptide repeat-containing protein [Kiritimatiellae bacterium]|nr:pentapeptide repeat-containing protein [Kiritimatiellia bacterium]
MKPTKNELAEILRKHKAWLENKPDGEKADLRCADLRDANLRCADLRDANLQGADLQGADLRCADLRDANLQGADLQGADLRYADLRRVYCDRMQLPLLVAELRRQIAMLEYMTAKEGDAK